MPATGTTLKLIGAAEGSWYTARGLTVDARYNFCFANANSGLSFGTFQFDVAKNQEGKRLFQAILAQGVSAKLIDLPASQLFFSWAATPNAGTLFNDNDRGKLTVLLTQASAMPLIDLADQQRAVTFGGKIDRVITKAAAKWNIKQVRAPILTQGGANYIQLFAYLMACMNRYPANQAYFEAWLAGETVKTYGYPNGTRLTAPPTLDQMHDFLKSLRIWNGTQGNYRYLRDRMDPTLARLAA